MSTLGLGHSTSGPRAIPPIFHGATDLDTPRGSHLEAQTISHGRRSLQINGSGRIKTKRAAMMKEYGLSDWTQKRAVSSGFGIP